MHTNLMSRKNFIPAYFRLLVKITTKKTTIDKNPAMMLMKEIKSDSRFKMDILTTFHEHGVGFGVG